MLSMNRSTLATALEVVATLDSDLTTALGHANTVGAATCAEARSLWELRRSLERSVTSTRDLREELLGVQGDASEHYKEVALRERTAAIVTRLADLALAEYEPNGDELYRGRFRRLVDVSTHVLDQIGTVNEACFRARVGAEGWRDDDNSAERLSRGDAYSTALASAHDAFLAIGRDEDLSRFLRAGAAVTSEPFRTACRAIATLLDVDMKEAA